MRIKYIVGSLIIVLFSLWGVSEFFNTTIQYVSLEEAAAADRVVQVLGAIDFSTVDFNPDSSRLEFQVYNSEAEDIQSAERLSVVYYGVVPGNFDQATSVVLKGKPNAGGVFVARQMLVKCPSKYQGDSEGEYQDIRKHDEAAGASTSR